jgi:hypothetical protein
MCLANIIVAYGAYYKFRLARFPKSFSCINCLAEGLRDRAARSLTVVAASNLDPSIMPGQFTLPLFSHYSQQQTELQASAERQNFSAQ